MYIIKCPECNEGHVRQTGRRLQDQVDEHLGKVSKSNILRHPYQDDNKNMSRNNFQILGNGYKKMKFKHKLSEASQIKELRPSLKRQETSVTLKLLTKFWWRMQSLLRHLGHRFWENSLWLWSFTFFAESSILDVGLALNMSLYSTYTNHLPLFIGIFL